jgi:hypothetical protein
MKPLPIVWQRIVSAAGTTCPRCQGTHEEVQRAVARLRCAPAAASRLLDSALTS